MRKKIYLLLTVILGLTLSLSVFAQSVWEGPTGDPPANNRPAPLDVSSETQTKTGGLNIQGSVGIGVDNPSYALEVGGSFKATSGYIGERRINSISTGSIIVAANGDYSGWYKIASSKLASGGSGLRGGVKVTVTPTGGYLSPRQDVIYAFKNWTTATVISQIINHIGTTSFSKYRIALDNDYAYLEGYTSSLNIAGQSTFYVTVENQGYNLDNWTAYSGELEKGLVSPVAYDEMSVISNGTSLAKNYIESSLGIGTVSPAELLEINDTSSGTARLRITDTSQNPELQLQYGSGTDDHWAFYVDNTDNSFKIWSNGENYLTIDHDKGSVIVSAICLESDKCITSWPSGSQDTIWTDQGTYVYPSNVDSFRIYDNGNLKVPDILGVGKSPSLSSRPNSNGGVISLGPEDYQSSAGSLIYVDNLSGAEGIFFDAGGDGTSPDMVIMAGGNVGIGSVSPTSKLEITEDGTNTGIKLNYGGSNIYSTIEGPDNRVLRIDIPGNDATDGLLVRGSQNSGFTYPNNVLFAGAGGNVGIGTTNPQNVLDLGGATNGRSLTWSGARNIGTEYSTGKLFIGNHLSLSNSVSGGIKLATTNYQRTGIELGGGSSGDISFVTRAADGTAGDSFDVVANTKMIIKNSGNVGIGTISPLTPLDIRTSQNGKIFQLLGNNNNIDFVLGHDTGGSYGFYWRYVGAGSGNYNSLQLWTQGQTGTDVQVYNINQDGKMEIKQQIIVGSSSLNVGSGQNLIYGNMDTGSYGNLLLLQKENQDILKLDRFGTLNVYKELKAGNSNFIVDDGGFVNSTKGISAEVILPENKIYDDVIYRCSSGWSYYYNTQESRREYICAIPRVRIDEKWYRIAESGGINDYRSRNRFCEVFAMGYADKSNGFGCSTSGICVYYGGAVTGWNPFVDGADVYYDDIRCTPF